MSLSPGITCWRVKSKIIIFLYNFYMVQKWHCGFPLGCTVISTLKFCCQGAFTNYLFPPFYESWIAAVKSPVSELHPADTAPYKSESCVRVLARTDPPRLCKVGFWQHSETWSQEAAWKKVCHSYSVLTDKQAAGCDQPSFFFLTSAQMRCVMGVHFGILESGMCM